jgi:hypothetical protein
MKVETKKVVVETMEIHYEVGDLLLVEKPEISKSKWFVVISIPKNKDYFDAIPLEYPLLNDGRPNEWHLRNEDIAKNSPVFHFPIKGIEDIEITKWK